MTLLETFEELISVYFDNDIIKAKYGITQENAEEKFDRIRKSLQALEIIKKRKIDILKLSVCANYETFIEFLTKWNWNGEYDNYIPTREEYDLVKEILLWN